MKVIKYSSSVMVILDIVMTIWGSVVVFGAWASWTYDKNENQSLNLDYEDPNPEGKNFCEYTPMMTAFVLLLLKWVICPQNKKFRLNIDDVSDSDPSDNSHPLLLCVLLRLLPF